MKRILMLTTEYSPCIGGIATYVKQLATATSELGCDVTVVAPDHGGRDVNNDAGAPFEIVRFHGDIYTLGQLPSLLRRVKRWVKKSEWDIVHAADWPNIMGLAFLKKFAKFEFQAAVYGTEILSLPKAWQVKVLGVRRLFETPSKICAISNSTRELLLKTYPRVDPNRVEVVPLGIGREWFADDAEATVARDRYHIHPSEFVVLTVARLDERKGHDAVLRAISSLPKDIQEQIVYLIAGSEIDHTYAAKVKQLAKECHARVVFAGEVPQGDLKSMYRAADVFCMPGRRHKTRVEGFGLAYLEAASQEVPSIAGKLGGMAEVVVDGKTGLLVEPGDEGAIAAALERLLGDQEYRTRLGRLARKRAESYTWEACAKRTFGL